MTDVRRNPKRSSLCGPIHLVQDRGYKDSCCFCGTQTDKWNTARDVPCCPDCAEMHTADQLPSRVEWLDENTWDRLVNGEEGSENYALYRFRNGKTFSEMQKDRIDLRPYQYSPRWQAHQFYLEWLRDLSAGDQFFAHYGPNGENCAIFEISRTSTNQIVVGKKKWSRKTGLLIGNDHPIFRIQEITAQNLRQIAGQKQSETGASDGRQAVD